MIRTEVNMQGPNSQNSSPDRNMLIGGEREGEEEEQEEEEEEEEEEDIKQEQLGGEDRVNSDDDYDTDLELRGIEISDFG